ncbi:c-type cytochrome [Persicimonas caeni]|uniref:C-type cytochrome n=1 Tax=Persicimonas caeni TaxID=2292766 RepID=A0A4Y6PZD9_PERCE|nr:FTR1 family protein [Persicimonas caeni]QDG53686.1 c-type cytochrome [Persicimonas caeni]QED34907.1 c-type cytochrome [Persicimonas caeni]
MFHLLEQHVFSRFLAALILVCSVLFAATASAQTDDGHRLVGLLDYIGADYAAAVKDGEVINDFEFREMQELADDAQTFAKGSKQAPEELSKTLVELDALIERKASRAEVAQTALHARKLVVDSFEVALAPTQAPELTSGRELYEANCVQCHGADGRAQVPGVDQMEPTPTNFTDAGTRAVLSPYRVFNTTSFGIEGTPMRAFSELSASERWDIAFYVMSLAHGHQTEGSAAELPESFDASLATLASLSDRDLRGRLIEAGVAKEQVDAAVSYLRVEAPKAVEEGKADALAVAFSHIDRAESAFEGGDYKLARKEVLSAYLDGFEPVESRLSAIDGDLVAQTEAHFMTLRDALENEKAERAEAQFAALRASLDQAEAALGQGGGQAWTAAVASAVIILREGLEVVLLIGLLLGLLRRFGAPESRKFVHAGWAAALLAGGATWWVANELIAISGAGRELIEGIVGLLAAAVLFSVSYWFMSNLHGQKWLEFIKEKIAQKASGGQMFALFGLAFLAVYREAFETILFYQALLIEAEGSEGAVIAGMVGGGAVLAVVAVLILKAGKKLPIKPFFAVSGALLYALCIVLVGSGLHAFVEAGYLPVFSLPLPTVSWLGFYPEVITVTAQTLLIVAGVVWGVHTVKKTRAGAPA